MILRPFGGRPKKPLYFFKGKPDGGIAARANNKNRTVLDEIAVAAISHYEKECLGIKE
jgi:hypothetical protein